MAHIQFSLDGPFEVHTTNGLVRRIKAEHVKRFWLNKDARQCADMPGCYIFALRYGHGHTPWYVGKTGRTLFAEIFTHHKLNIFNDVFDEGHRGTPVIFFVTRADGKNAIPATKLGELEKFLIQTAKKKNRNLKNTVNTKNIEGWSIDGVYRSRRTAKSKIEDVFKKMMGL